MAHTNRPSSFFSKKRIYFAIIIGLSISSYLLFSELNNSDIKGQLSQVQWTFKSFVFLVLAMILIVVRDFAYMIRLRLLTDRKLSWKQSLRIILMWEFASAISPGVVGGSAVAMFFLKKENIPLGKSTAIVITTALFDNLFYLIAVPFTILFIGFNDLIPSNIPPENIKFFWFGYIIILLVSILLSISLFVYPKLIKSILLVIFKLPYLNKRKTKAEKIARDIIIASKYLKGKTTLFWIKLMGSTTLSWTSRFLVVNSIIMAFSTLSFYDNLLIFTRQLIMWLMLLVTPTPGGSGMVEYLFSTFLGEFLPFGILIVISTVLWRMISYYPYLFIGSFILPKWLNK